MMTSVIRTEWLKLKHYRPFWILLCLYPVCLAGVVGASLWAQSKFEDMAHSAGAGAVAKSHFPLAFPTVWQSVGYTASWLHFIPALILMLTVTNEFSFRTHRQNLLEGWSRAQFLWAKLAMAIGLAALSTFLVSLLSVAAGIASHSAPTLQGAKFVALFFLQATLYNVFAVWLAFVVRRAALALAAYFMYSVMVENLLSFFLSLKWEGAGSYLPLEAAGSLVPVPFLREQAERVAPELLKGPGPQAFLAITLLYLILLSGFLWWRYRHEDL